MAKRRRRQKSLLEKFSNVSIIGLVLNPVTMMILVSIVAMVLWNKYHSKMDLAADQKLQQSMIQTNPPPDWIKTDVSALAIKESRLNEVALSQPDAIERVVASFAVQPWVKRVDNAAKTVSGIQVQLTYRTPRAIVEIGRDQLVPIDDEAVVLDGRDFNRDDLMQYWRVSLNRHITSGLSTGRRWDDIRIADSVAIANAWANSINRVDLFRIVNRSTPTRDRLRLNDYELWTRRGTIVIWGNAPGLEKQGEASAAKKIEALVRFVQENGPLDAQNIKILDVRSGNVIPGNSKLAKGNADFVQRTY